MSPQKLHVLVLDDEPLIALDMAQMLEDAGYEVVGPATTLAMAASLVASAPSLAAAVLDMRIDREWVWPLAETIAAKGVPIVLVTGDQLTTMPPALAEAVRIDKPIPEQQLLDALAALVTRRSAPR
ncbi:MAG: response regulator [Hyphomicrobiaceae bacterium]